MIIGIEKENGFSQRIEMPILAEARNRLGKTIDIQFEYVIVIKIEKEPNGKFKFVVQNIKMVTGQ